MPVRPKSLSDLHLRCAFYDRTVLGHIFLSCAAAGGDLNRRLIERGGQPFPEEHILTWLVELCSAMHYVHKKKVLHRDLKLQNIFLSSMSSVRLGDFGIARVLKHTFENAQSVVGTPYYLSPEICMRCVRLEIIDWLVRTRNEMPETM